jgi:hypothetical protein
MGDQSSTTFCGPLCKSLTDNEILFSEIGLLRAGSARGSADLQAPGSAPGRRRKQGPCQVENGRRKQAPCQVGSAGRKQGSCQPADGATDRRRVVPARSVSKPSQLPPVACHLARAPAGRDRRPVGRPIRIPIGAGVELPVLTPRARLEGEAPGSAPDRCVSR